MVIEEVKPAEPSTVSTVLVGPADMQEIELAIRATTIVQARGALLSLVNALEEPATAPRALHLIAEVAETYRKMLAALGMPGARARSSRADSYQQISSPLMPYLDDESGVNSLGSVAETQPGGETFAGQVVSQILAVAREHLNSTKDVVKPPHDNSFMIENLTRALATAKSNHLNPDIILALQSKLTSALNSFEKDDDDVLSRKIPDAAFPAGVAVTGAAIAAAGIEAGE